MKKYFVLYHAPQEAIKKMASTTPEDASKAMEPWLKWAESVGKGMVDLGTPLGNGQKVTKKGLSPSNKNVVGYSILQAESMDEAVGLLKGHPHLEWLDTCEIEVHESLPLPGN